MTGSHLRTSAFALCALLFALIPAHAADRVALVIGNGAYKFASPLPNPVNDATDIGTKLKTLGFDVYGGNDLDLAGMQGAMRQFADNSPGAKVALFFYAGHGMEVNGKNYLVPVDAKLETATALAFEVVDANVILNIMVEEKRIAIALLDACRDNPLARSFRKKSRSAVGSGLAEVKVDQIGGGGLLYGLATAPGDTAADGEGRNSPFTKALLKHIGAPGVEFEQMMKSVKRDVDADTKGDQRPYLTSSLVDDLYLVPAAAKVEEKAVEKPPAAAEPSQAGLDWGLVKDTKSVAVLETFIAKHSGDALYRGLAEERIAEIGKQEVAIVQPGAAKAEPEAAVEEAKPAPVAVNGTNVAEVRVNRGIFRKQGDVWIEIDLLGKARFTFAETGRDDASVYLKDASRNMTLQLDLRRKMILFRQGSGPEQALYEILGADKAEPEAGADEPDPQTGPELVAGPSQAEPDEQDVAIVAPPAEDSGAVKREMVEVSPQPRVIPLGKWPEGMALGPDNTLWIAESGSRQIVKIDLSTGQTVAKVPVGRLPVNMAAGDDGSIYSAVLTEGKVFRQPPAGKGRSIATFKRPSYLSGLGFGGGALFAVTYTEEAQRMSTLTRIDPATGKLKASDPLFGQAHALSMALGVPWILYLTGEIVSYDPTTLQAGASVGSPEFLWSLAANSQALYAGGRAHQTEGSSLVIRMPLDNPSARLVQPLDGEELIGAIAATDTRVAALGYGGSVWILDAADLTPLKHFNTGVEPRSAMFVDGLLYVTTHRGENGALLVYEGLTE